MKSKISVLKIIFLFSLFIINIISVSNPGICKDVISGRYINRTFLEQLPGRIPGTIPVYCLEINFSGNDSTEIFNGFEEYKLAYRTENENGVFEKAMQGNDLHFTVTENGDILLFDSAWTGIKERSVFTKVNEDEYSRIHKWVIEKYLNEKMLAGNYILSDKSKSSGDKIILTSDGKVTGLRDYTAYTICFSGDCTEETKPVSNTVNFNNDRGTLTTYSFEYDNGKNSVIFRKIAEPDPGIKGEREIRETAFELVKE